MIKNNIKRKLKTAPVRIEIDLHRKAMAHAKKNGIKDGQINVILVRILLIIFKLAKVNIFKICLQKI
ncbi:MAG: hypothetical protein ACTSUK_06605 [Promethearchaeota archaeon]